MAKVTRRRILPKVLLIGDEPRAGGMSLIEELEMDWVTSTPDGAGLALEVERPAVVLALGRKAAKEVGIVGRLMREVRNVLVWYYGVPCIATWPPDVALANEQKGREWTEDVSTLTVLFNIETGQCAAN